MNPRTSSSRTAFGALPILAALACAAPLIAAAAAGTNESPAQQVDALRCAFGTHHARAVHAKGIILEGSFTPASQALSLTDSPLFTSGAIPVTVRFSDFTGIPDIPENIGDANPRGFAVKFRFADSREADIVTHSFNGFPTANSDEFAQLLRAIGSSGPEAEKPTALDKFLADHPVAKTFLTTQKPAPASFGTLSYFGVNAFAFIDAGKQRSFVRYRFVPSGGEQLLDAASLKSKGPNYLSEEVATRVARAPIRFDWYAQVAAAGDVIDNPSVAWPESRRLVKLGTISIERVAADQGKTDKALLFLPARVPSGIEVADPMIAVRSAAYPISFGGRQ